MANNWYYKLMGEEFGPLTSSELRQYAADGRLTRDAYVRRDNEDRWVSAESIRGLFDRQAPHSQNESATTAAPSMAHSSSRRELHTCENCGRTIGTLESTHQHDGHMVCHECATRLRSHSTPTADPQKTRAPRRGEIICPNPNCGFIGQPKMQPRGSLVAGCLLTLFFVLPGLIYFALMSGYTYICPKCGVGIRSGTHN